MPTDQEEEQGPNTGFVNFQNYFQANKGTAQAGADKYAGQVKNTATQANDALENATMQFNKESQAGTVAAPNTNVGPSVANRRGTNYDPASAANAANGSYTGPAAITGVSNFQNAVDKANTAENQLNALAGPVGTGGLGANGQVRGDISTLTAPNNTTPGANNFSANLIGSAGAQQFQALRAHFNPNKDLAKAVTDTTAAGTAAKAKSDANEAAGQKIQNAAITASNNPAQPSNQTGIPDSITTVDQAIASGYGQDEIVKKFGYGAYDDSVNNAMHRGQR